MKTIADLIKEYDLDVLEIDGGAFYMSCGRGLSIEEFNELGKHLALLVGAENE